MLDGNRSNNRSVIGNGGEELRLVIACSYLHLAGLRVHHHSLALHVVKFAQNPCLPGDIRRPRPVIKRASHYAVPPYPFQI